MPKRDKSKYIFGEVVKSFFGVITVRIVCDCRAFREGEEVIIKGRHKFPIGSLVGVYFNGSYVARTLALIRGGSEAE